MIANEMKYNFLVLYDKMFEYGGPAYDDKQISSIFNKAQNRVFRRNYRAKSNTQEEGFEATELNRRNLEQFIKSASITGGTVTISTNQTGVHPNGTFYDMPDDFLLAISEAGITGESSKEVTVKPVTHDEYNANVNNPYKKPYKELIWRMDISREVQGSEGIDWSSRTKKRTELIVGDKVTYPLSDYRVRYLITPPDIVVDENIPANQVHCILDESLHDEIVDEAVKIAVGAVKPEEYQIAATEQKVNES